MSQIELKPLHNSTREMFLVTRTVSEVNLKSGQLQEVEAPIGYIARPVGAECWEIDSTGLTCQETADAVTTLLKEHGMLSLLGKSLQFTTPLDLDAAGDALLRAAMEAEMDHRKLSPA
jgi:hypothetical protein